MGIGASDGAYYEDDFDRLTGKDGNKPDAESKGSRAPSDVSITFRNPNPNPAGDSSGSGRTRIDPSDQGVLNPDTGAYPHLDTKDWNERTPEQIPAPQDMSGKVVPISDIEDRRNENPAKAVLHFLSESMTPGAAEDLIRNPAGQKMVPNTPLGEQLGMKDLPEPGQSWVDRLSMVNTFRGMFHPDTTEDVNLLKGFYDKVKSGFSLMGDVFGGEVDPMSDQGIERAADLAGLMVFGPRPVAQKMADGTLGSFAGVRSLAGRTDDFATSAQVRRHFAERMEQSGEHPDDIWTKTGWMRGNEGKWKYEIDDSKAEFNDEWNSKQSISDQFKDHGIALDTTYGPSDKYNIYKLRKWKTEEEIKPEDLPPNLQQAFARLHSGEVQVPLSKIWDHPELYKAYPDLKNMNVVYEPELSGGYYNPIDGSIHLGPGFTNEGVIAHEVQHAIQEKEGFARGGATGTPGVHYQLKLRQAYDDFMTEAKKRLPEIDKKYAQKGALGLSNEDMDFIHRYSRVQVKFPEYLAVAGKEAYQNYMRLGGEVEARNTATRLLLNQAGRLGIPPSATIEPEYLNRQAVFTDKGRWATPYGYKNEQLKETPEGK